MRFKNWDHSILCGYSRELANNCTVLHSSVLYCIKREGWKREKWENLMTRKEQTDKEQSKNSTTESTLILSGYSRELANIWAITTSNLLSVQGRINRIVNMYLYMQLKPYKWIHSTKSMTFQSFCLISDLWIFYRHSLGENRGNIKN